jgi:hypothetical protein
MTKFIVNPVTGEYESTAYTFRDRFDLKNQFSTQGLNDGGRVGFREGTRANQYSKMRTVEELQLIIDNAPQIKVGDKFLDMNAKDLTGESEVAKEYNRNPNYPGRKKGIEYISRKEMDKFGKKGTNELVFEKTGKQSIKNKSRFIYATNLKDLQPDGLNYKGDLSTNFIHPYPKVIETTTGTTGKGNARINRSLSGYDKKARPIAVKQVELIKNKENMSSNDFNNERMKLNAQAKQVRENIVSKKGNIAKNYTGYYRVNESGTNLDPKGFNAKKSFAGIGGEDIKFNDMTKNQLAQFKEEKLNYDKKIKTLRNFGDSIKSKGLNLFSKLEKGSPSRKIFETLVPGKLDAAVLTPYDFITSMASGYNLPESVVIAASNLLPKSVQKMLPTTLAVYENQKGFDGTNPILKMNDGEETKIGKKIRTSIEDAFNKVKDKFEDNEIENADNKNSIDIPEIDGQFMAAEGGRVNFGEGSPDPDFLSAISAARDNDNIPIGDKTFLGMKLADNPLQRFNEMIDPRAYPYYGQKISEGASRIPEYAFRTVPALAQATGDLIKGRKSGKMDRFMEAISPTVTNKAQEAIGLTKLIEDTEKNRTEAQKGMGGQLEFLAEVPGPATPFGLLAKTPKFKRQLRGIAGSSKGAKELKTKIENKLETVDQGRRDTLLTMGAAGAMGLVKALGLDKLIPVGSKVAQKTTPIVTPGGTPKYFFDFVNLIKKSGDDISETAATVERQKVYDYKGYTMYEDVGGEIRINKQSEGMGSGYDEAGERQVFDTITGQEEIMYRPGEEIVGKDGKAVKTLDEYEEATAKPDSYGDMEGEDGLDSIDEILDLLSKDGKTYSKTQLQEMGIIPENLVKPKKAGGGIMKLAGDDSGPPPTSGPDSEGLALILKRGRKY